MKTIVSKFCESCKERITSADDDNDVPHSARPDITVHFFPVVANSTPSACDKHQ